MLMSCFGKLHSCFFLFNLKDFLLSAEQDRNGSQLTISIATVAVPCKLPCGAAVSTPVPCFSRASRLYSTL